MSTHLSLRCVAALFLMRFLAAQADTTSIEFIKAQEEIVLKVAANASALHARRTNLVEECSCSQHACSSNFTTATCVQHLGTPAFCDRDGRRIDVESSTIILPPGTDPDNLSDGLKESVCVYKAIEDIIKEHQLEEGSMSTFVGKRLVYYTLCRLFAAGTLDGHFRIFPGLPRARDETDGEELVNGCRSYDPRVRPWFIAASTGPKDVVLVVDASGSMASTFDGSGMTKWDLVTRAVNKTLDTFTFADFVNVLTFSNRVTALWKESGLARGNRANLDYMKAALSSTKPAGKTNFAVAFEEAFRRLMENCTAEPAPCSQCQKIVIFLTDGRDTSEENKTSIRPSRMARIIEKQQRKLEKETMKRAAIFTYSMSEDADDAIPRQISCANDGAWAFIGVDTKTLDALNSYYLYTAAGKRTETPVWIEPYEDAGGLGIVTTVAMPFYAKGTKSVPDIFLGVAGHDVLLSEFGEGRHTADRILFDLIDRSERCAFASETSCELQVYRHAHDDRSICADIFPVIDESSEEADGNTTLTLCYEFGDKFYRRSGEEASWKEAKASCKSAGGQLVSIADPATLGFLANLSPLDGSWVGAERTPKRRFSWLNDDLPNLKDDSDFWGAREPAVKGEDGNCTAIDNRGIIGNMNTKPCEQKLSYICEFDSKDPCNDRIGRVPKRGYFSIPPIDACSAAQTAYNLTRPVGETKDLASSDVVCDLGTPDRTNEELICCSAEDISP